MSNELQEALEEAIKDDSTPEIVEDHTVDAFPYKSEEDRPKKKEPPKHMTKDEWEAAGKDPSKYKSKEQFESDGKYLDQIKSLKNKIRTLEEKTYQGEHEKYTRQRQDAEFRRDQAIMNGKLDQFHQATQELSSLREPEPYEHYYEQHQAQEKIYKDNDDFMKRNRSWWNSDSMENIEMVEKAQQHAARLQPYLQTGELTFEKLVTLVEGQMQKDYPHKFGVEDEDPQEEIRNELSQMKQELADLRDKEEESSAPAVESNSFPRSKFSVKDIPEEYRATYVDAVKLGLTKLTPKQYYEQLKGSR